MFSLSYDRNCEPMIFRIKRNVYSFGELKQFHHSLYVWISVVSLHSRRHQSPLFINHIVTNPRFLTQNLNHNEDFIDDLTLSIIIQPVCFLTLCFVTVFYSPGKSPQVSFQQFNTERTSESPENSFPLR